MKSSNWIQQLDEIIEVLKKATPNHPVFRGGKFAIMTGEKPKYGVHPGYEGENQTLTQHLDNLKAQGHIAGYEAVKGQYGGPENSFLIHRPNFEKIKELGEKFGQESVVLSNNGVHHLAYTNGELKGKANPHDPRARAKTTHMDSGVSLFAHPPKDFYTTSKDLQGQQMTFRIPFNFGKEVPLKTRPIMEKSDANDGFDLHLNFNTNHFVDSHSDKHINMIRIFKNQRSEVVR